MTTRDLRHKGPLSMRRVSTLWDDLDWRHEIHEARHEKAGPLAYVGKLYDPREKIAHTTQFYPDTGAVASALYSMRNLLVAERARVRAPWYRRLADWWLAVFFPRSAS